MVLTSSEFLRQLGNTDIGGVDDHIFSTNEFKRVFIYDGFASHGVATVVTIDQIIQVD